MSGSRLKNPGSLSHGRSAVRSPFGPDMSSDPSERQRLLQAAIEFAREQLGPASERLMSTPAAQALLLARLRAGRPMGDAVLSVAHLHLREDPRLADEFLTHFLDDAYRNGRRLVTRDLRSFLETGDLVHSVAGDLWEELTELSFEGRSQFLALVTQRLRWRASDEVRRMRARGGPPSDETPGSERELIDHQPPPDAALLDRDETEQLVLRLMRLPERDQLILRLYLRGEPVEAIARACDLQPEAARKALQRALERARSNGSGPASS